MRKFLKILGITMVILVVIGLVVAIMYYPSVKKIYYGSQEIVYDSALTIYLGGGGNSVVFNTDTAVLVVDTKYGKAAEKLYNNVMTLARDKPVIVINTHSDLDHTGGNAYYKGAKIISGKVDENYWIRASGKEGMPDVWVTDTMKIKLGNEPVTLIPMGQAHTWSDIVVYFPNRGLLVTGDLIFNEMNVFFGKEKGSDGNKALEAVKKLKTIPGVRTVVPGHGKTGGPELISRMENYYLDMKMAAANPDRQKEIEAKYKDWLKMPGATSPRIVIEYFRDHK